jgi:hypothetical protein
VKWLPHTPTVDQRRRRPTSPTAAVNAHLHGGRSRHGKATALPRADPPDTAPPAARERADRRTLSTGLGCRASSACISLTAIALCPSDGLADSPTPVRRAGSLTVAAHRLHRGQGARRNAGPALLIQWACHPEQPGLAPARRNPSGMARKGPSFACRRLSRAPLRGSHSLGPVGLRSTAPAGFADGPDEVRAAPDCAGLPPWAAV